MRFTYHYILARGDRVFAKHQRMLINASLRGAARVQDGHTAVEQHLHYPQCPELREWQWHSCSYGMTGCGKINSSSRFGFFRDLEFQDWEVQNFGF